MIQQWEEILKERLSTILDGLLGSSHQAFYSLKS